MVFLNSKNMDLIINVDKGFVKSLQYNGKEYIGATVPLGNVYFYNCSFTVVEEIDGERCSRPELIREHAENLHLINTEFLKK